WGGVLAAEWRRRETGRARGWVMGLAVSQMAGALCELVLLAQDLDIPYLKSDFAMGVAPAGGTGALLWGAAGGFSQKGLVGRGGVFLLTAFAITRIWYPIEAGFALCALQAVAVFGVLRAPQRPIATAVGLLLMLAPIIATHGPWAYVINHGRRNTDW